MSRIAGFLWPKGTGLVLLGVALLVAANALVVVDEVAAADFPR